MLLNIQNVNLNFRVNLLKFKINIKVLIHLISPNLYTLFD